MTTDTAVRPMTTDELLALPDDGIERWLIDGQLREGGMTVRNRHHSRITSRLSQLLWNWVDAQPEPRGAVYDGEVGCVLKKNPDRTVGIDVAYLDPTLAARNPTDTTLIDGVPTLVVEVLSPSDTLEDVDEKIDGYLQAGVPHVWVVDPHDKIVTVHRPGQDAEAFNVRQELTAEPHLPGFRVAVTKLFA